MNTLSPNAVASKSLSRERYLYIIKRLNWRRNVGLIQIYRGMRYINRHIDNSLEGTLNAFIANCVGRDFPTFGKTLVAVMLSGEHRIFDGQTRIYTTQ